MTVTARNIDFSKVKDGGNFNKARVPAGDYLAKIVKIEDAPAKDETPQYLFTIQLVKRASSKLPYYCKLQENQLWKLRNILIAGGLSVPKSKQKVDPNRLLNKLIGVTIEDAEYEGKEQSEIAGVFPAAELGEADDDEVTDDTSDDEDVEDDDTDEEAADEPEEEEAEEEVEDEEEDAEGDEWDAITDRLELRKALKKVAPEVTTSKAQSDDDIRNLIRAALLPAEPKKKAATPAAKKAAPKKPINEVSDEELEELDIDDL